MAVSCLEQLHTRELYDILPIEALCQELLNNGSKSFYEDVFNDIQDVFDTNPSLKLEDKIRYPVIITFKIFRICLYTYIIFRICALLAICTPKSMEGNTQKINELCDKGEIPHMKM